MIILIIFSLLSVGFASIADKFENNGILYKELGRAKLMFDSKICLPQRFDMDRYINNTAANESSDVYAQTIWKTTFYNAFAEICSSFNLSDGSSISDTALSNEVRDYLVRIGLNRKLQKFHHDLRAFFLYNRIPLAFFDLVDKKWLADGEDLSEFLEKVVAFPVKCDLEWGVVYLLLCPSFDEFAQDGTLYAIAHAGQFMAEGQIYVSQEVPEYVVMDGNGRLVPIDINDCKVMHTSIYVCMSRAVSSCDVTTMTGCEIVAQRTTDGFMAIKSFDTDNIVATNLPEINLTGTTVNVPTPIFIHHTLYRLEVDGDERRYIPYSKVTPVKIKESFPSLSYSATKAVLSTKETIRLYNITRKGIPMLSNQSGKGSVWENVKDFFLHLI